MDQVRADVDSGRANNGSGHADDDSSRVDDDSGGADVVGEAVGFVHGDEIEAGIGAGSSSNCAKLGKQYVLRARKAIQGYFGPDSTQYIQDGGTRQSDRKTGGGRVKIADFPKVAYGGPTAGAAGLAEPRRPRRPPKRCRPCQRSGRPTPCGDGTPSPRAKGRGTASRATPHGRPGWAAPGWHPAPGRSFSQRGA